MDIILKGILLGMILAISIGPVFFSLIQTSIERGFRSGLFMAFGITLSDTAYIALTYLGISQIADIPSFGQYLGVGGGLIMLIFGVASFFKPLPHHLKETTLEKSDNYKLIIKGFLLNGINPFVLIFWIGVVSMVTVDYAYNSNEILLFFLGIILTIFITDAIKSYLANKLRGIITVGFIKWMNVVVGIALIGWGLWLFYYAFEEHYKSIM
jgi:threonine/homoserine/homoserine lactone efflux protein